MAKAAYTGVNGVARNVKSILIGVDGVARNVKSGYIGVDGAARQFFPGHIWEKYTVGYTTVREKIEGTYTDSYPLNLKLSISNPYVACAVGSTTVAPTIGSDGKFHVTGPSYNAGGYWNRRDISKADEETGEQRRIVGYQNWAINTTVDSSKNEIIFDTMYGQGGGLYNVYVEYVSSRQVNVSFFRLTTPSSGRYIWKETIAETAGTKIGTVVSGSPSAYPTNGKHTDGYWYVKVT